MHSMEHQIVFPSAKTAELALKAVSRELANVFEKRSKTSIKTNKNLVLLKIVSRDEPALRASAFAYTRLLGLCRDLSIGGAVDG